MTPARFLSLVNGRHGHFLYESGYHSDLWFDLETLCQKPAEVRPLVGELSASVAEFSPDILCGPLIEGAFVSLLVAAELGKEFVYTVRVESAEKKLFPVTYELPRVQREKVAGRRVVIVNDVISAGSAVRGTLNSLKDAGAEVAGVAALVILGDSFLEYVQREQLELKTLLKLPNNIWTPEECPLCTSGVPLERLAEH